MSWKSVLAVIGFLAIGGISFWAMDTYKKDQEFRQHYGRVTPVAVFNWEGEVENFRDKLPVILYFHSTESLPEQKQVMLDYAWNNAGKVKVVSIDLDRLENLIFALRYGVARHPAYVVVFKDKTVHGYEGLPADRLELDRLVNQAR